MRQNPTRIDSHQTASALNLRSHSSFPFCPSILLTNSHGKPVGGKLQDVGMNLRSHSIDKLNHYDRRTYTHTPATRRRPRVTKWARCIAARVQSRVQSSRRRQAEPPAYAPRRPLA
jgi:hypothetical protein